MTICIIPARGGSRRIQKKNIRTFFGKPIICYSIETARASGLFDKIIVSTDDDEIARVSEAAGAEVLIRPAEFCRDDVGTQEVMAFVLEQAGLWYGEACCLYATAPLVLPADLSIGHALLSSNEFAMAVGAEPLRDAGQWYWGGVVHFRNLDALIAPWTAMVPIPEDRVCDVNTPEDWSRCEQLYAKMVDGNPG